MWCFDGNNDCVLVDEDEGSFTAIARATIAQILLPKSTNICSLDFCGIDLMIKTELSMVCWK